MLIYGVSLLFLSVKKMQTLTYIVVDDSGSSVGCRPLLATDWIPYHANMLEILATPPPVEYWETFTRGETLHITGRSQYYAVSI